MKIKRLIRQPDNSWQEIEDDMTSQEELDHYLSRYKDIEEKAIVKRSEYLTAELLPESPIRTMKLAKLEAERTEIEKEYADIVSNVIRLGGNDAIANLI